MNGLVAEPPKKNLSYRSVAVERRPKPAENTSPVSPPAERPASHKREMPAVALVVALLALAMVLFVPALVLLGRLQP